MSRPSGWRAAWSSREVFAVLRFDPFSELDAVTQGLVAAGREAGSPRSPRFMPMDLYQVDDHYVLTADLPGADPGSIDVDVENGVLTLTGRRTAMSDSGVRWLTSERFSGVYRRQLTLGEHRHCGDRRPLRQRRSHSYDSDRRACQTAPDRRGAGLRRTAVRATRRRVGYGRRRRAHRRNRIVPVRRRGDRLRRRPRPGSESGHAPRQ